MGWEIKYNKRNNTYFIYEMLVRSYLKNYSSSVSLREKILNIIRTHFHSQVSLGKERNLYEQIIYMPFHKLTESERLYVLRSCRDQFRALNREELESGRKSVLGESKKFDENLHFLEEKINDYKFYANIYRYFHGNNVADLLILEKIILNEIEERQKEDGDGGWKLLPEGEYDVGKDLENLKDLYEKKNPGFYLYLYDKVKEYKAILLEHSICSECEVCDVEMKTDILKIYHRLEEMKKREIRQEDIAFVLDVSKLITELKQGE